MARLLVCTTVLLLLAGCQAPPPAPRAASADLAADARPVGSTAQIAALAPPAPPTEVTLTFALPRGDVASNAMGAVGFSEPMVALGALDLPAAVTGLTVQPPITLRFQWIGTSTLAFYPEQPLPGSTSFTVQVQPGWRALSGRELKSLHAWTFRTPRIHVVQTAPTEGATEIDRKPAIGLRFDQAVDLASLQRALTAEVVGKGAVAVSVELGAGNGLDWAVAGLDDEATAKAKETLMGRVAIVRFAAPLPGEAKVAIHVAAGVHSLEGADAGITPFRLEFTTFGPLGVTKAGCEGTCRPDDYGPVELQFNNQLAEVAEGVREQQIKVTPPLAEYNAQCWGSHCSLLGKWQPGKNYTVTVDAGLTDAHRQKLGKPLHLVVTMGHYRPQLDWASDGGILERAVRPARVGFNVRNLKSLDVQLAPLPDTGFAALVRGADGDGVMPALPPGAKKVAMPAPGAQDVAERRIVDLGQTLGDRPGLMVLAASSPEVIDDKGRPIRLQRLLQVTDLHLDAKASAGGTLVWVTSYATGKPVEDVEITAFSADEKVFWRGSTDDQGLAHGAALPSRAYDEDDKAPILLAKKADDRALLRLTAVARNDWSDGPSEGDHVARARPWLFLDKNVYRLGEAVHVKGVVRRLSTQGLQLPTEGTPVTVTVTDPTGREVAKLESKLSAQGTFHVETAVPAHGTYGTWEVRANTEGESVGADFHVLVYRAPKFRMATKLDVKHAVRGDTVHGSAEASWYTGGPMAGAAVKFTASGGGTSFQPPGWPAFDFGRVWYDDTSAPGVRNYLQQEGQGKLDEQGRWPFQFGTNLVMDRPLQIEVEATVTDPNGNPLSASAGLWLHPASFSLGLALQTSVAKVGEVITAQFVAATPTGEAVPGVAVQADVQRVEWKQVRLQGIGGQGNWQVQRVMSPAGGCKVTTAGEPTTCTLKLDAPGLYVMAALAKDEKGRLARTSTQLHVVGPGAVTWAPTGEGEALLTADKTVYHVGDVARILVRNPVPGAMALVTLEQGDVLSSRLVTLTEAASTIEVPIEARHQPDVFVSVALFIGRRSPVAVAGEDTGAPQLQLGYLQLRVDPADRRLQVQIEPSAQKLAPGAALDVAVTVKDAQGRPRPAEVTLWAVDEGVMALTAAPTPEPMAAMYADLPLGVRNYAAIGDLVRGRVAEDKGADGGGGGMGTRAKFRDVAFYAAALQAGPDGVARGHFTLPDNLTTFRIMAVAIDGPAQFGSSDAKIQVSKPLMLLTSVPHAVQVGDRFELAAVLRNQTGQAVTGTLRIDVGAGLSVVGAQEQQVTAKESASQEVLFTLQASQPGTPKVTLTVTAGAERDSVQETLRVLDPRPLESTATYGFTADSLQEILQKSAKAHDDVGGLYLTAAASGLVGLQRGLEWLIAYPYGCTEQVASQLLALIYTQRFAKEFGLLQDKAKTAGPMIDAAIGKLLAMRHTGEIGGFALWPDSERVDAEATAWALMVLKDTVAQGHAVEPAVFRQGAAFLRSQLDSKRRALYASDGQFGAARALYLASLAHIGEPDPGYLAQVLAERKILPADAQLLLGRAAAEGGQKAPAQEVLDDLTRQLRIDGETAFLAMPEDPLMQGFWPSAVRTNALLLDLMAKVAPDHPLGGKVVRWLVGQRRDDRWASTQDNAWALQSLAAWYAGHETQAPDFALDMLLGGKSVGHGAFHKRTLDVVQVFVPHKDLPAGQVPIVLQKTGKGALYYGLRYEYSPAGEAEVARNAGFLVRRTVIDGKGQTGRTTLDRGEEVLVAVTVLADAPRSYVAIVDRLPAGLQPVDFSLATGSQATLAKFNAIATGRPGVAAMDADSAGTAASFREFAPGEVRFFADGLTPGLHTFTYVARAAVRGHFTSHGARAEAMYNPEVFGSSGPSELTVK